MAATDESLLPMHKRLAMGQGATSVPVDTSGGWPGLCGPEHEPAMTRGAGRASDARTVSATPQPTRPIWMDQVKGVGEEVGEGVRVREHVRSRPGQIVGTT